MPLVCNLVWLPSNERNVEIILCNGDGIIVLNEVKMLRLEELHFTSHEGK